MWVRKRIDIAWADLLVAVIRSLVASLDWRDSLIEQTKEDIANQWPEDSSACFLSVRSGFDAILGSAGWPSGSEIVFSGLTIEDMKRITEANGYCVVPVDIAIDSVQPITSDIEKAVTSKTRAIVITQLFGQTQDLKPVQQIARRNNLLLIEDCAQSYDGEPHTGSLHADVSMFSFGPIKTATALGGAVFQFRNPVVETKTLRHHESYPCQSNWSFLTRVLKYCFLKALSIRIAVATIFFATRWLKLDFDQIISRLAKGFAGEDFFQKIRRQPSSSLLMLLSRRLQNSSSVRKVIKRRKENAKRLYEQINAAPSVTRTSRLEQSESHSHWVTFVETNSPKLLVAHLASRGFDATNTSSMVSLKHTIDSEKSLPNASRFLTDVVFLPASEHLPVSEIDRMANAILEFQSLAAKPDRNPRVNKQIETAFDDTNDFDSPLTAVD